MAKTRRSRRVVRKVIAPFQRFFELESSGGILLIISTIIALILANSGFRDEYFDFWNLKLTIGVGDTILSKSLVFWVNDALMAIFFFVVGLEIKREILAGELSSPSQASLPIFAALGGMVVPALAFIVIVGGGTGNEGWGIPMATDIAFSLGILKLLGNRVPLSLKIFLTAFAIVDDIGAVLIIALFYTADLDTSALILAALFYAVVIIFNIFYLRNIMFYMLVGAIVWFFFLKSGIHPTVAGVLLAFAIPAKRKIDAGEFVDQLDYSMEQFNASGHAKSKIILNPSQIAAISTIESSAEKVQSPLQRLENQLHGVVIFLIMPIFALANAGVELTGDLSAAFTSPVTLGIMAGLVIGKVIGVTLFSWIGVKMKLAFLPANVKWKQILGLGFLGGIGFTMSLFIANLAYLDAELLNSAKIGILFGSLISGFIGYFLLRSTLKEALPED